MFMWWIPPRSLRGTAEADDITGTGGLQSRLRPKKRKDLPQRRRERRESAEKNARLNNENTEEAQRPRRNTKPTGPPRNPLPLPSPRHSGRGERREVLSASSQRHFLRQDGPELHCRGV